VGYFKDFAQLGRETVEDLMAAWEAAALVVRWIVNGINR